MHKTFLLAASLAAAGLMHAQTPEPATPNAPAATPGTPEQPPAEPMKPAWLLYTGSFEFPHVTGRTVLEKGGNPVSKIGRREWVRFQHKQGNKGGELLAGLTNEVAHTGHQSLYVEFNNLTAILASAELASDMISIRGGQEYHVSIWGLLDKKRPITLDQRTPALRLEVEFFQADKETQTGEPILRTQSIPGTPTRPLFSSERWAEFYADVTAPDDAAYMRVTWALVSPPQEGKTDGVIFLDDANIKGPPGKTQEEIEAEQPEPTEPAPETTPAAPESPKPPAKKN